MIARQTRAKIRAERRAASELPIRGRAYILTNYIKWARLWIDGSHKSLSFTDNPPEGSAIVVIGSKRFVDKSGICLQLIAFVDVCGRTLYVKPESFPMMTNVARE